MAGIVDKALKAVKNQTKGKFFVEKLLFPAILLLYPLRHMTVGVEWWDTGYNYGNFMYMDRVDPMWLFSTYLANALGHLFTRLPFGNRMLGLNFYTGLVVSLLALGGYYFFTKKIKIPSWIVFLGEMLAISLCWCPTALLYNYLTYALFGGGVVALYCALTQEKKGLFILAGVLLGVNVFVRFSNLAEMALILAVWAYGVIRKSGLKQVAAQTGRCVLGYGLGVGACLGYFSVRYGFDTYISSIGRLLAMPSEASDYTVYSMIVYQLRNYLQNLIWLRYLILFVLLGMLGFALLGGKLRRLLSIGYVACVFAGFYYLMQKNMFNMKYSTKMSVFQWAVFFLTATVVIGVITIFRKKAEPEEKLLAGLGILVLFLTPLGSNNHLYSSINHLFFVAPFTLWMLVRFLKLLPEELECRKLRIGKAGGLHISAFPVKAMLVCMLLMLAVQSAGFGIGYVFSESDGGENLHTKIENNGILKGMYTSPERAEAIGTISAYVEAEGLAGREVILYGQIPAMSYYLQMPFAITAWPDLRSYNYAVMESDLERLAFDVENKSRPQPVVLLEAAYGAYLKGGTAALTQLGWTQDEAQRFEQDKKFVLLRQWMDTYGYEITFENEKFTMLEAG